MKFSLRAVVEWFCGPGTKPDELEAAHKRAKKEMSDAWAQVCVQQFPPSILAEVGAPEYARWKQAKAEYAKLNRKLSSQHGVRRDAGTGLVDLPHETL